MQESNNLQRAIITFKNPETKEYIDINLCYDKDQGDIDYDVKFSEGYNMTSELDLIGFLAHMFLTSLQNNKD